MKVCHLRTAETIVQEEQQHGLIPQSSEPRPGPDIEVAHREEPLQLLTRIGFHRRRRWWFEVDGA